MYNVMQIFKLLENTSISRRSFLKGTAALGAMAAVYGCGKEEDPIYSAGDRTYVDDEYFTTTPVYRYGTSAHNCGGRCIIKAQVVDGNRIVRFLTDETTHAYDGSVIDNDGANTTQARACSRCRAYRGRLYHPGRLKYPLKQTKERGDITGFQRITWKQAISEIAERLKAVQEKYGAEAFHPVYACGNIASSFQGGSYTGLFEVNDFGAVSPALRLLGGASGYTSDYSFHQGSYMGGYGTAYSGMINMGAAPLFYESAGEKHFVMWGSNIPTTHNPKAFSWTKAIEGIKANGGTIKFIGPELSEIGVAQADVWYQTRPYTDVALILGMLYHMITLTFNPDGTPTGNGLDVDYLDQMVYGFFETPEYWRNLLQYTDGTDTSIGKTANENYGQILTTKPSDADSWVEETGEWYIGSDGSVQTSSRNEEGQEPVDEYKVTRRWKKGTQYAYNSAPYTYVAAIPAGQSFSAYIMGNDDRLTKALYSARDNYMANQFSNNNPSLARNTSIANYTFKSSNSTKYAYKNNMNVAKTPLWASKITGIAEEDIKELAEFYLRCGNERIPVYNEWAGGQLKQNDGTITLYAIQALLISTKNWGYTGTGIANNTIGVTKQTDPNQISAGDVRPATWNTVEKMGPHPKISVTQWHNAIKMAFSKELAANGYTPNIPDWQNASGLGKPKYSAGKAGQVYFDDGGVKSLVNRVNITGVGKMKPVTFTTTINVDIPGKGNTAVTHTYYDFKGNTIQSGGSLSDQTNNVEFSGFRFILNSAGNIPMNQHANPIDSARMYKALPTFGYGNHPASDMADAFYLVTFDNFMSPSARYSDYVLPAQTTWEQADFVTIENSGTLYVDAVKPGPGESKSSWEFVRDLISARSGTGALNQFIGGANKNGKPASEVRFDDVVRDAFENTISKKAESPYFGKTWEQFLEKPISHAKPSTEIPASETNSIRAAYDTWTADTTQPFYPGVTTVDWSNESGVFGFCNDLYDTGIHGFAETESCPKQTGMFHVYSGTLVWRYENLYSKWHGYLPKENQGQINKDEEGDPIAWPIPVYFDYQDHFRVAYGLTSNDELSGRYLLTTTHDRFRAHSSQAENPYLRELTHRVKGGALYSGNDAGNYANIGSDVIEGAYQVFPHLNELIDDNGLPKTGSEDTASYADIWVNSSDFAAFNDGDLVKVYNEIGAVICTIRKTDRCVPGYVGLHQGCWVDLRGDLNNTASLIDVGGNCNTLMPSTPSRLDHGNGVQSAMVNIVRYNG